jgi:uncharacterized protein (DUF1330 family)
VRYLIASKASAGHGRFLARGGTVTPLAGAFVPERVVLLEFATADAALGFYLSDRYAPLLKIRLATTEARLAILARSGALPAQVRGGATRPAGHLTIAFLIRLPVTAAKAWGGFFD